MLLVILMPKRSSQGCWFHLVLADTCMRAGGSALSIDARHIISCIVSLPRAAVVAMTVRLEMVIVPYEDSPIGFSHMAIRQHKRLEELLLGFT